MYKAAMAQTGASSFRRCRLDGDQTTFLRPRKTYFLRRVNLVVDLFFVTYNNHAFTNSQIIIFRHRQF